MNDMHAVQKEHIGMNAQFQRPAESLYEGACAGPGYGADASRLLDEMVLDGAVDDARDLTHHLGPTINAVCEGQRGSS